jgi:DNA-binding NarL/FixJ family response regulator
VLRILVAENHDVVRNGIRELLAARPEWNVVGEARTGRQALDLARRTHPDVAVVDLSLPELAGVEAIRQIRTESPETEICVFSMHEDETFVGDAIAAGARAYVLKSESGARLVDAVDALARHEPFFSLRVAGLVLSALVQARATGPAPYAQPLTHREREVAQLLVEGLGSRAVASRLGITPKTVDTHRAAIMRKLGMSSMADLVRFAIRHHWSSPEA